MILTGGCQCGRVRFAAEVDPATAYFCHCGMCRKATGGVFAPFVTVAAAAVTWDSAPDDYRSSPIAIRGFCAACGSPLSFRYPDGDAIDLLIGAFDDPTPFVPSGHFSCETMIEPWIDAAALPRTRLADNAPTVARWMRACGKLPD